MKSDSANMHYHLEQRIFDLTKYATIFFRSELIFVLFDKVARELLFKVVVLKLGSMNRYMGSTDLQVDWLS